MQILNRLRRAGVLVAAALALAACQDGFFFDPAPGRVTPVVVQWEWQDAPMAGASSAPVAVAGAQGPQASPGAAFDKADGAQVVLRAGDKELFNQRVALEAVGSDKKLSFNVELPAGSAVQASLDLTLLRGQDALFTGTSTAQLTPGQAAEVNVPLSAVITRIVAGGPYTMRVIGGTLKLAAWGLFATNDSTVVAATFSGLDPNVTVTADGTITAVSNGIGRVLASYLGRVDTARVTVEDRCFGPYATLALGQTANGSLETNDCSDAGNFSYNDWYQFTVATPSLVRATLTGSGFEPFVGANYADKRVLAVAANAGSNVVISDYHLPAGTYLVRAGSRARTAGPNPTGAYSLKLEALPTTEPNAGCLAARVATWMVPGNEATAQATADDCVFPNTTQRYDRYGIRLQAGDTVTVSAASALDYNVQYQDPSDGTAVFRAKPADGGPAQGVIVGSADASHYFWFAPQGSAVGEYTFRVERGVSASYRPCSQWDALPISRTAQGDLDQSLDCVDSDGYIIDSYRVAAPANVPFQTTLSSTAFDPFVLAYRGAGQTAGRASTTGSVVAEHLYPAGTYRVGVTARNPVSAGARFSGDYTLASALVAIPQDGCPATGFRSTFVDFGSQATGRITSNDCRDLFSPDTATVTRWVDGYAILLQPGETVTVTMSADFPANFTRWVGNSYVEGQFGVPAGETRTFTVTQPAGSAAFHLFNVISGQHQATGNYTMSFSGTPLPAPERVEGSGGWRPPMRLMAQEEPSGAALRR